jgi:hypothetical protein
MRVDLSYPIGADDSKVNAFKDARIAQKMVRGQFHVAGDTLLDRGSL